MLILDKVVFSDRARRNNDGYSLGVGRFVVPLSHSSLGPGVAPEEAASEVAPNENGPTVASALDGEAAPSGWRGLEVHLAAPQTEAATAMWWGRSLIDRRIISI